MQNTFNAGHANATLMRSPKRLMEIIRYFPHIRKPFLTFIVICAIYNCCYAQTDVPVVTSGGPFGSGSWLRFVSGGNATSIQENWGLNITGDSTHPVKVGYTSLLVGYLTSSQNVGQNNLLVSGRVGIGTMTPQEALSVNGAVRAQSIKVETANWPDFVFKPDYKLLSLAEVKLYIQRNRHLPDVPSAATIANEGTDLGEMNRILLKKVEELTLHLIKKEEEIKDIQRSNASIKRSLDQLRFVVRKQQKLSK